MFVYDKMSESFEFFEGEEKRRIKSVLNKTLNQKVVWHSIYFLFYWTGRERRGPGGDCPSQRWRSCGVVGSGGAVGGCG